MKIRLLPFAFLVIGVAAMVGGWWLHRPQPGTAEANTGKAGLPSGAGITRNFTEVEEIIDQNYVDEVGSDTLAKASIQGMLRSLDPHSNYFDTKEFQELQTQQHSQFFGIGVSINRRNDRIFVLGATQGTPAEKVGLRYGDAIVGVDGKAVTDWTTDQVRDQIRGPQGEVVEITVERVGVPKPLTFKIARDVVPYPSIRHYFMIRPGVGYIALVGGFNHTTEDELHEALQDLQKQGMRSLVLDLRDNLGGLLTQAVKVASAFLPKDLKVLSQKGRAGDSDSEAREYHSENPSPNESTLVVLINGGTASASEIVAGAIQDHDRGLIVGEPSFGKGLVQTPFRLPFGSGLTLTTAKYYTPSGRCIQRNYSGVSLYDYHTHHKEDALPHGQALTTDTGRKVYAGGGITPDVEVKLPTLTPIQGQLLGASFEFTRQLIGGQIAGFPSFLIRQTLYHHVLGDDEYPINDKVMTAFRAFLKNNPKWHFTDSQLTEHLEYARGLIREQVVTAAYGTEVGVEVRLQTDVQTLKALDSLQAARDLANNAQAFRAANPAAFDRR